MEIRDFERNSALIFVTELSDSDLYDYLWQIEKRFDGKFGLRFCRGGRMRTIQAFFDEFSAAFQFPYYFGGNWPALDECLNDLSWFVADSYCLCITSSEKVLSAESATEFLALLAILERTKREWGGGNPNLELMNRSPADFFVLFQVPPGTGAATLERIMRSGFEATLL